MTQFYDNPECLLVNFFNVILCNLQSTSLGVLSKCVASGGICKGNLQQGFSLWFLFECCMMSSGLARRSLQVISELVNVVRGRYLLGELFYCGSSLWIVISVLYQVEHKV